MNFFQDKRGSWMYLTKGYEPRYEVSHVSS